MSITAQQQQADAESLQVPKVTHDSQSAVKKHTSEALIPVPGTTITESYILRRSSPESRWLAEYEPPNRLDVSQDCSSGSKEQKSSAPGDTFVENYILENSSPDTGTSASFESNPFVTKASHPGANKRNCSFKYDPRQGLPFTPIQTGSILDFKTPVKSESPKRYTYFVYPKPENEIQVIYTPWGNAIHALEMASSSSNVVGVCTIFVSQ